MTSPPVAPPRWAVASSVGAVVALVGGWVTAEAVQPPGYSPVRYTISSLARHGAADRWIMSAGLLGIGVCHLVTAAGLRGARPWSRVLLAVAGVTALGVACCAQPEHGSSAAHLTFTLVGLATLAIWPLTVVSARATRFPLRPRDALLSALATLALVGWLVAAVSGSTLGLAERALTCQQELWPLLVVLGMRRAAEGARPATSPVRDPAAATDAGRVGRMIG